VADAAVVFAYRCGGSAGMPPARVTGFPFQPGRGRRGSPESARSIREASVRDV